MAGQTLSWKRALLAVFCGGFVGTLARYGLSLSVQSWLGKSWPYDILAINLTGALLLAMISTLADKAFLIGPTRRLLLNTGFMGAYTTFSSLALGDLLLITRGQILPALLYLVLSLLGGLGAVLLGDWLGLRLVALWCRPLPASTIAATLAETEELQPAELADEPELPRK